MPAAVDVLDDEQITLGQLKRRTLGSSAQVLVRGIALRGIAFVGTLVLARIFTPRDFGALAFGLVVLSAGSLVADGGIGASLVRRPEPPTRVELQALLGLQLSMTVGVAVLVSSVGLFFGTAGDVCAIMVWNLPLTALEAPGSIVLERRLEFGRRVRVEIVEALAFYGWAVTAGSLGFGLKGVAAAAVFRGVAGASAMAVLSPVSIPRPRLSVRTVRPLFAYGVRFQGAAALNIVRDQGVNTAVAVVGGVATLGLWSVAYRVMQIPFLFFEALWRVSVPAMAALIRVQKDVSGALTRALSTGCLATGVIVTPLAACAPALVPLALGGQWRGAAAVVPPACLGLLIGGPPSVAAAGYAYASGDSSLVLRASFAHTVAWFAVMLPLLPSQGAIAVGWGWLAASVVDGAFFLAALRRNRVHLLKPIVPAYLAAVVGYLAGAMVLHVLGRSWGGLAACIAAAAAAYLMVQALIQREELRSTVVLFAHLFRSSDATTTP